MTLTIITLLNC